MFGPFGSSILSMYLCSDHRALLNTKETVGNFPRVGVFEMTCIPKI